MPIAARDVRAKAGFAKKSLPAMSGHPTPTVLALDAAGSACSAALWRDGAIAAHRFEAMDYGHAEVLMPMVEEVIAGAGYDALDLIGVGVGPGAYTGWLACSSAHRQDRAIHLSETPCCCPPSRVG